MKPFSKLLIVLPVALILAGVSFAVWNAKFQNNPEPSALSNQSEPPLPSRKAENPVVLMFVGDIMLDRGVEYKIMQNKENWKLPFEKIASLLNSADLLFGNLESQISDKGYNVGSIYSFRANPKSMETLTFGGFDVVSVANNHSFDYTRAAFEDSMRRLKEAGISYTGGGLTKDEAYSPAIKEVRGVKIAFLGYTSVGSSSWQAAENRGGVAWIDKENLSLLKDAVEKASQQVDIVVVTLHEGYEYQKAPNDLQKVFAIAAIDAGADFFIGHHAHVVQPLEQYKDGWIAYGLGNFLFDQDFSIDTKTGAILKVTLEGRTIREVQMLKTKQNDKFQVELAP